MFTLPPNIFPKPYTLLGMSWAKGVRGGSGRIYVSVLSTMFVSGISVSGSRVVNSTSGPAVPGQPFNKLTSCEKNIVLSKQWIYLFILFIKLTPVFLKQTFFNSNFNRKYSINFTTKILYLFFKKKKHTKLEHWPFSKFWHIKTIYFALNWIPQYEKCTYPTISPPPLMLWYFLCN